VLYSINHESSANTTYICGQFFEYSALLHVPTFKVSTSVFVQTPKAVHYDHDVLILVMSDIGGKSRTLKQCLIEDAKSLDIPSIGRSLGEWLANLHLWGRTKAAAPLRAVLTQNKELANVGIEYAFKSLVPSDDPLWQQVRSHVDNLRSLDNNDSDFIVHGDFCTGNVLVSGQGNTQLTILDWETSNCRNFAWNDIGQMCSEMYQPTFFGHAGNLGAEMVSAFMKGYLSKKELSDEERRLAVVRFGVHLFVWPRVTGWGNKESVAKGQKLGREYIERGWNYDWEWLKDSVVRDLVPKKYFT